MKQLMAFAFLRSIARSLSSMTHIRPLRLRSALEAARNEKLRSFLFPSGRAEHTHRRRAESSNVKRNDGEREKAIECVRRSHSAMAHDIKELHVLKTKFRNLLD